MVVLRVSCSSLSSSRRLEQPKGRSLNQIIVTHFLLRSVHMYSILTSSYKCYIQD